MIIGYNLTGKTVLYSPTPSLQNSQYIKSKNCVVDEIHLTSSILNNSTKTDWVYGTVLLAKLQGDLEAGNIRMGGNAIEGVRVKRRNLKKNNFVVLDQLPFDPSPTQIVYKDYTVSSNEEYEYLISPVDETGIEGFLTTTTVNPVFDGWWLVDLEEPEKYNFQFLYNLDNMNITVDEDRSEVKTFSKYPKVYYGKQRNRKGQLSSLFIPDGNTAKEQYDKLEEMLARKKKYLLKDGRGRNIIVDIFSPSETIINDIGGGVTKIALNWVEVDEYID